MRDLDKDRRNANDGQVEALDAERTRLVAGREADARAYLLLRPYRSKAVKVALLLLRDLMAPQRLKGAVTARPSVRRSQGKALPLRALSSA